MTIKQITPPDAVWLSPFAATIYLQHYADTWYDGGAWYVETYFNAKRLQKEFADADAQFFSILLNEEPVGFFKLLFNSTIAANALELERIYLDEHAGGQGIGSQVMALIFEFARQQNITSIVLKVMDSSPKAVRFYQKFGFQITGTTAVNFPQKKEDMRGMYVMQKNL